MMPQAPTSPAWTSPEFIMDMHAMTAAWHWLEQHGHDCWWFDSALVMGKTCISGRIMIDADPHVVYAFVMSCMHELQIAQYVDQYSGQHCLKIENACIAGHPDQAGFIWNGDITIVAVNCIFCTSMANALGKCTQPWHKLFNNRTSGVLHGHV